MVKPFFSIPDTCWEMIISHLRKDLSREACGLLGGRFDSDGSAQVFQVYPGTNTHTHPNSNYLLDPKDQYSAMKDIRKKKLQLVGIYHSHPHTPPDISLQDIERAYSPSVFYLIVSLTNPGFPQIRNYRISGNTASEHPFLLGNTRFDPDPRDFS